MEKSTLGASSGRARGQASPLRKPSRQLRYRGSQPSSRFALAFEAPLIRPVTATVTVPLPRDRVYNFLDVLSNHECFTDHFLVDWELSGPPAGVGARARMRVKSPGPDDWLDMEVIAGERPRTTVEQSIGAKGRRRTRGTYLLDALPDGGTRVTFELAWLEAPLRERLLAPVTRSVVGRANAKALRRLADVLSNRTEGETG